MKTDNVKLYDYSVTGKKPDVEQYITITIKASDCANAWRSFRLRYPEFKINTKMVKLNEYRPYLIEAFRYKKSKRHKMNLRSKIIDLPDSGEIYDMPPTLSDLKKDDSVGLQSEFKFTNPFTETSLSTESILKTLVNYEIKDLFLENPKNIF